MANGTTQNQKQIAITIRPDQIAALDRLAVERDRNRSYMIRQAVDLYLAVNAMPADLVAARTDEQEVAA